MEQREIKIITFGTCGTDNLDTEEWQAFFGTILQRILAVKEKEHV